MQDHGFESAVDGGIGADAQPERDNGHKSECRMLCQNAHGKAEIFRQAVGYLGTWQPSEQLTHRIETPLRKHSRLEAGDDVMAVTFSLGKMWHRPY